MCFVKWAGRTKRGAIHKRQEYQGGVRVANRPAQIPSVIESLAGVNLADLAKRKGETKENASS